MNSSKFIPGLGSHQPALSLMLAAILWGLLWWPLRYFNDHGINALWSSVIAYSFALFPGFWLIRKQFKYLLLFPVSLLMIAITSGLCNVSFIVAVAEKDAARMVLLFYLSPIWSILLGVAVLRERPSMLALSAAVLAMIGAVFMLYDPNKGTIWPRDLYDWLAIFSGLAFSVTNLLIRRLEQVPVAAKTFSSWLGVLIIASAWIIISGWTSTSMSFPVISQGIWLGLAALGLFGVTTMTLAVQYGVSRLPLFKSSIILVFEVVVTIVSSLLILPEEHLLNLAPYGAVCIVFAAILAGGTDER